MGFLSPSAMSAGRSTGPGFHTRFVPPAGFSALLTAYSLTCFPTSRAGTAHGVQGPPEPYPSTKPYASRRLNPHAVPDIACSCSEDQEVTMPRSSRALLSVEIRTGGEPGSAAADALMGFLPQRNLKPEARAEPVTRPLPLPVSGSRTRRARSPGQSGTSRLAAGQVPKIPTHLAVGRVPKIPTYLAVDQVPKSLAHLPVDQVPKNPVHIRPIGGRRSRPALGSTGFRGTRYFLQAGLVSSGTVRLAAGRTRKPDPASFWHPPGPVLGFSRQQ
jgi:hypothetical protein